MKTTSSILGRGKIFEIDSMACMNHAMKLIKFEPFIKKEPWHNLPPETQLLFKIAFISICHQINWDFLQERLYEKLFLSNEPALSIISSITPRTIKAWLEDYPKQERVRAAERAKLIKNVAVVIKEKFEGNELKLYEKLSSSRIENGDFEKVMGLFEAYRQDPLRKKTNVLSHEITTEQIFKIVDEQNLEPAVDYHIIRIYLRSGRVVPKDKELFKYFTGTPNPRTYIISQLRKTVSDALKLTAHYASLNVAQVNFIEWQLGRSTCTNEEPRCELPPRENLPKSISKLFEQRCPYNDCCTAFNQMNKFIEFEEPLFFSTHY